MDGVMHVVSPTKELDIPFIEGESVLSALNRVLVIPHPCHGVGFCGLCRFDILLDNGERSPQLACKYPAKQMTIFLKQIVLKEQAI